MRNKNIKLDWNDIAIIPKVISDISSRSEINPYLKNGKLPLFTAPMDTVVDMGNCQHFVNNGINVCFPRHIKFDPELPNSNDHFYSYGVDEIIELFNQGATLPKRILIDTANGHMRKLYDISRDIKLKLGNSIELMIGNIANPETYIEYCKIGVDYVRVGIGSGQACTTSANVGINYPMASLVRECADYKDSFENPTKIVADGGFKNYSDILKALALGADYVMLGSIFNKCLESCGTNFVLENPKSEPSEYKEISKEDALSLFKDNCKVYKYYRGMSTKEVQRSWNKKVLKTGEGISKYNLIDNDLESWVENFTDYLRSQMSYTDSLSLEDFIGGVEFIQISSNAFKRFDK